MKNLRAKTRPVENPYETYEGKGSLVGWTWRVLKHYQTSENEKCNSYARAFCAVRSPYTFGSWEFGDVYVNTIPGYIYDEPVNG